MAKRTWCRSVLTKPPRSCFNGSKLQDRSCLRRRLFALDVTPTIIVTGLVNLLAFPLLLWYIKRKLERFDNKREDARFAQAESERRIIEQREAERTIILAMSRTMLLNNYEKCMEKGYYSIEEREVYHKLYTAYRDDSGNGVIEDIAPRIRALPVEPPKDKET